jgi:hypothetical protein
MIVIMLFLYSCSESKSEESGEGVEEVSFDYSLQFNDIDIMSADSLRYQLEFDMVGIKSLNVSIEINDILYSSFNIVDIDSSDQLIDGNLPFNQQSMNIRVSFIQDNIIMAEQYHMVPKTREVEVLTISNTSSDMHFDALFDKNKFVNNSNLIYEKFKKYDFANTEVIILNDINSLSEKIIVELQKFLLNEGYIFVLMNDNIKDNNELYYSLGFPKVKAVRGSSRNQFFSLKDKDFLEKHTFTSMDLVSQSEVYRYFQFREDQEEFSKIMISTDDPLLLEKDVLGGKIFFLTTKKDSDWSDKSFDLLLDDILNRIFFQRLITNES